MPTQRFGGSFAPALSDSTLSSYASLVVQIDDPETKEAFLTCLNCCQQWWDLPESSGEAGGTPHPSGRGSIIDLDPEIKQSLDVHIPWKAQLDRFAALFDAFSPLEQKELRDAAHHLLWHVNELNLDREPITADKLKK